MSDNRQSRLYHSLPFLINVSELSEQQIDDMVNTLIESFGAKATFGKDIFMEVLQDHQIEAADPMKFQRGPFVGLRLNKHGEPTVTAVKDPNDLNTGVTIYGYDQFLEFAKAPEVFMAKALESEQRKEQMRAESLARRKHSQDSGLGMG